MRGDVLLSVEDVEKICMGREPDIPRTAEHELEANIG